VANPIPVTVFTSFDDDEVNRLVRRLRGDQDGQRVHAIVPRPSRKRLFTRADPTMSFTNARTKVLGKGCACCTVRADLMTKIERVAKAGETDHIVLHAARSEDLVVLAKTFSVADRRGAVLSEVATLESLVVLVNPSSLQSSLNSAHARTYLDKLLMADLLVLNDEEGAEQRDLEQARQILAALNPAAKCILASELHTEWKELRGFTLETAQRRTELEGLFENPSDTGTSSTQFVFEARTPFHPARLGDLIERLAPMVLRARGQFWVATRPDLIGRLDIGGGTIGLEVPGPWWSAVPTSEHPKGAEFREYLESASVPPFGDRRQQIAVVGIGLRSEQLRADFTHCLLTDEELSDPDCWSSFSDPFDWPSASS